MVECHRIAYDWDAQLDIPNLIEYMGAQPVRTHIRAALEALDINYTYKETIIPEVIDLLEGSVKEENGFFKESEA